MPARLIDPRIKLRHVVCFLEVARQKSVVAAAAALGVTQPAASKTIHELEELLGVALFDRSRRSLFLTPFGEVFQRYAGAGITALRQGIDSVAAAREEPVMVKVGALPTVSAAILPEAVRRFTAARLPARVRIVTGPNAYLLSQLRLGDVDLVVGRMAEPEAMLGFAFEHLYSERVMFVVRPGHPLLAAPRFELAGIAGYQVLMPPPGSIIRPSVERLLLAHGVEPLADEVETVSNTFGRAYVLASDAIWIISRGVVAGDIAAGELVPLPVDTSETLGPVGLTTRSDVALPLPVALLAQAVRDVTAEAAAAGRAGAERGAGERGGDRP